MKKPFLLISLLLVSCISAGNLVENHSMWSAQVDEYGSSLDTSNGLIQSGSIKIGFSLTKLIKEDEWPYIELIGSIEESLGDYKAVEVTFKCKHDVLVKLSQADFSWEGDESYAHYQNVLPASSGNWHTMTLPFSKFMQPDWAPDSARKIPLKLSEVSALYFTPILDHTKGESTILEIKSVRLIKK